MIPPSLARAIGLVVTVLALVTDAAAAVTWTRIASGFVQPVDVVHAVDGSGRLFVAEQGGRIWVVREGQRVATPFLDLADAIATGDERGLLGLAFHPRFAATGWLFVNFTRRGDGATVIARFSVAAANADRADRDSETRLLTIPQPFANHNGGALRFGPDGYLYIGMGDGGSANDPGNRAQDRAALLGKILRIDVDRGIPYAIPPGNPYADGAGGRPEIFALGVRNPWKLAFDRVKGDLYFGDVGQDVREELHHLSRGIGAGANFGWRVLEGTRCTGNGGGPPCGDASYTPPIAEYDHAEGCSVTGGVVYRGNAVPGLVGRYLYGDFCSGKMWSVARDASGRWIAQSLLATGLPISTFGEDEAGEVYFADYARGELHRLASTGPERVDAIEYYHGAFDHWFVTTLAEEQVALDSGATAGWTRTGRQFAAYDLPATGTSPVCRFYLPPAFGDTHFLSASPIECADVRSRFPGFVHESPAVFHVPLPDLGGACAAGTEPVYRLWNRRVDTNHRYTTDRSVRDALVAGGYVAEGYGPDGVAMCAPTTQALDTGQVRR